MKFTITLSSDSLTHGNPNTSITFIENDIALAARFEMMRHPNHRTRIWAPRPERFPCLLVATDVTSFHPSPADTISCFFIYDFEMVPENEIPSTSDAVPPISTEKSNEPESQNMGLDPFMIGIDAEHTIGNPDEGTSIYLRRYADGGHRCEVYTNLECSAVHEAKTLDDIRAWLKTLDADTDALDGGRSTAIAIAPRPHAGPPRDWVWDFIPESVASFNGIIPGANYLTPVHPIHFDDIDFENG